MQTVMLIDIAANELPDYDGLRRTLDLLWFKQELFRVRLHPFDELLKCLPRRLKYI